LFGATAVAAAFLAGSGCDSPDMDTNLSVAKGLLRWMSTAQEQFKQAAMVDLDGDKVGEFGFLSELTGALPTRSGKQATDPFLAPVLGKLLKGGIAEKNGYYFRLYLATAKGPAIAEPGAGTAAAANAADADAQEQRWCCYAWPVEYGRTGEHVLFAIQKYSGLTHMPEIQAAFRSDEKDAGNILGGLGMAASTDPHSKGGDFIQPKVPAYDGEIWYPGGA
jgi:hypothetical protein